MDREVRRCLGGVNHKNTLTGVADVAANEARTAAEDYHDEKFSEGGRDFYTYNVTFSYCY